MCVDSFSKARATHCDFLPQVSEDDSTEEADHIETSRNVYMNSAVIFSLHVFGESVELVHIKSQWHV